MSEIQSHTRRARASFAQWGGLQRVIAMAPAVALIWVVILWLL